MLRRFAWLTVCSLLAFGCRSGDDDLSQRGQYPAATTDGTAPGDDTTSTITDQITVTITPDDVELPPGGTQLFVARVQGTVDKNLIWTVQEGVMGGSVANGNYTAPPHAGTFHVEAASRKNPLRVGVATVVVTQTPPPPEKWLATSAINAPEARTGHVSVWTGTEVIIWGGNDNAGRMLNTGARYNAAFDSWHAYTSQENAPYPLYSHTAVWTGSEMILWGRGATAATNQGWRYEPASDSWSTIAPATGIESRYDHTAVWTGSEMIVWGGRSNCVPDCGLNTGGRYDPSLNAWTPVTTASAPSGRTGHSALWTGTEMIIWGGQNHGAATSTGGRYNPSTGSWVSMTLTGVPNARHFHSAVWTGTQMLVWGGTEPSVGTTYFNGGAYNPAANTWSAMSSLGAPQARSHHAAVWTGTSMLVWGGTNGTAGGVYSPAENTWKAMLMTDAPTRRNGFAAVWTGNEMVVWGGLTETGITATGGRYTPP